MEPKCKRKQVKSELVAIYRLEFYKNKKDWKLCTDAKKKSSAITEPKIKSNLNKTYEVHTDEQADRGSPLNKAFIGEQPVDLVPRRSISSDPGPAELECCQQTLSQHWPDEGKDDHVHGWQQTGQEWCGVEAELSQELSYDVFDQPECIDENSMFVPYEHMKNPDVPPPPARALSVRTRVEQLNALRHLQAHDEIDNPERPCAEDFETVSNLDSTDPVHRPELLATLMASFRRRFDENDRLKQHINYQDWLPERGEYNPNFENVKPEFGTFKPEFGTVKPEFGTVKSEFGTVKSEFGTVKSEFGTFKPELGTFKPEFGTFKPELGTFKPELGTFKPGLGTFKPEFGALKSELGLPNWHLDPKPMESIPSTPEYLNFREGPLDPKHAGVPYEYTKPKGVDLLSRADECLRQLGIDSGDEDVSAYEALASESRDFIRGAHLAPHSSETDLTVECACVSSCLHAVSPARLRAALRTHTRAVRRLLAEHAHREMLSSAPAAIPRERLDTQPTRGPGGAGLIKIVRGRPYRL